MIVDAAVLDVAQRDLARALTRVNRHVTTLETCRSVARAPLVDLDSLRVLLDRDDGADRAFVDAMIRIGWSRTSDRGARAELAALHAALRAVALRSHAELRGAIAEGALRGAELRRRFDDAPVFARDHFVEEVLGIAYPPLEEPDLGPELLAYAPSGYDEIVHALDATALGPVHSFLDLGSGTGKAVMLAELLTGATSTGIECNGSLHALAESAARSLGLRSVFRHADVRDAALDDSDVVFMYLPFTGSVLASVMTRLSERAPRFLCAGAFDMKRYRKLVAAGPPRSWLHVYAWR